MLQTGSRPFERPRRHIPEGAPARGPRRLWEPGQALRSLVWILGAGGFFCAFLIAPHLAHPNLLRVAGLIWFCAFGLLNGYLVLRDGRR
jgi:hypothetical protein